MPPVPTPQAARPATQQAARTSPRSPAPRGPDQPAPSPELGAAAAAGVAGGAVAAAPAVVPALALAGAAVLTTAGALKVIDGFLERLRFRNEAWIRQQAPKRGALAGDILTVIADENERQADFERKVRERVTRDFGRIFGRLPDPVPPVTPGSPETDSAVVAQVDREQRKQEREELGKVLKRERRYARQRSEAMAVRAIAALDRTVLKRESPQGAFWKLDPNAKSHTADCVAMAGKFWPWAVLDDFHPPTHAGCLCTLHSFKKAVARGWMKATDVMDLRTALMRAAAAKALAEADAFEEGIDALVEAGVLSADEVPETLTRILRGGT